MLRPKSLSRLGLLLVVAGWGVLYPEAGSAAPSSKRPIAISAFRLIPSESGDVNYYKRIDGTPPHIRGEYRPPYETAVLGYEIPEKHRRKIRSIEWKWRAITLPKGGNDCVEGKGDSAATIYVTWKRGLRWYSLKYVWSAAAKKGTTCRRKRNPFRAMDTVIVESGGPLNEWRSVRIDPDKEFRNHFEDGDPDADVPDLIGIGIMTDGDQTKSVSIADYGDFALTYK